MVTFRCIDADCGIEFCIVGSGIYSSIETVETILQSTDVDSRSNAVCPVCDSPIEEVPSGN